VNKEVAELFAVSRLLLLLLRKIQLRTMSAHAEQKDARTRSVSG